MSELLIAKSVIKALIKQKKSICVAESITGGGLGEALTQIPGASKVFVGGVIAYSDELKVSELGVSKADLKNTPLSLKRSLYQWPRVHLENLKLISQLQLLE